MSTVAKKRPRNAQPTANDLPETLGELLKQLGGISPRRIRMRPAPGTATEKDVLDILDRTNRQCELVNGVLVEKVMGYPESALAMWIGFLLQGFLEQHDLGILAGSDGALRLMPRLVRMPDVSFIRWDRLPSREPPSEPIPGLAPDLAVEVLSKGNTPGEMKRKLREYFATGVEIVWLLDLPRRTVQVYTAPDRSVTLTEDDTLDGGQVLPGLALPVRQVFAKVPRQAKGKPGTTKPKNSRGRR
jgi:Uma2 family endonuclease